MPNIVLVLIDGMMLGFVSRSGVSSATGLLQMKGLIRYARGRTTLLNPKGVETISCECYRILSRTINSLLPPDSRSKATLFPFALRRLLSHKQ